MIKLSISRNENFWPIQSYFFHTKPTDYKTNKNYPTY